MHTRIAIIQPALFVKSSASKKESALDYRNKMQKQISDLRSMIGRSQLRASQDPVLIEHQQEDGEPTQKDIEAEVLDDSTI